MKKLYLDYDSDSYRENDENDYKRKTVTTVNFKRVSRTEPRGHNFLTFEVSEEVFTASEVFLVWVRFSRYDIDFVHKGDYKVIEIYSNESEAKKIVDQIYDKTYKDCSDWEEWGHNFDSCEYEAFRVYL